MSRPEIWSPTPGRTVPYPSTLGGGGAKSTEFTALVAKLVEIIEAVQLRDAKSNVLTPAEITAAALALLSNMAIESAERSAAIFDAGAVDFILECERSGTERQKEEAAKLMQNLRYFEAIASKVDQTQGAAAMLQRAQEASDVQVRVRAMRTLALALELNESTRDQLRKSKGALKWVSAMLEPTEPSEVVGQAAFVLANALLDAPKMQAEVAKSRPTLDRLVTLVFGDAARFTKRYVVRALKRVAESNDGRRHLPDTGAKAALQAVLSDAAADDELKAEAQEAVRLLGMPATGRFGFFSSRNPAPPSSGDLTA